MIKFEKNGSAWLGACDSWDAESDEFLGEE